MSDASKTQKNKREAELEKDWKQVKDWLREHPDYLRGDGALLSELHLWNRAANVVEFGPAALTRMSADKSREKAARKELEQIAQANFAAQAQTHAAVIDLLESRNHSDLARRVDDTAQLRFGLAGGVIAAIGLMTGRLKKDSTMPMGPSICGSAMAYILIAMPYLIL